MKPGVMKLSHTLKIAAAAIACIVLQACVLIPIAGFGYTGYQYHEKEGVFAPGQPLGSPAPDDKSDTGKSGASKPPPASSNNIE